MSSPIGPAVSAGLMGGVPGCAISALLNYYLLPFPETALDNAIGHGVGGFMCGFIAGFVGVAVYVIRQRPTQADRDRPTARSAARG